MRAQALEHPKSRAALMTYGLLLFCIGVCIIFYWGHRAELLRIIYPVGAVFVGGMLYAFRPATYLAFTWWIWFLSPWARRIIDYQAGFGFINVVMITPYLVLGFTLFTALRYRDDLFVKSNFPLTLVLGGILYAYCVGLLKNGLYAATFSLLQWLTPILLGIHLLLTWRHYPEYRQAMLQTFVAGAFLLGLYGVFQYITAPPWDAAWMINSGLTTIGKPEPYSIRVFGTLNVSGLYAGVMMVCILMVIAHRNVLAYLAVIPAVAGLLLSLTRSAWGGLVVGILIIITRVSGQLRKRLIMVLGVCTVLSIPLMNVNFISEGVGPRMETLSNLEEQGSYRARSNFYETFGRRALTNPIGNGLGGTGKASVLSGDKTSFDSGLMVIPYELGWPGALLYLWGLGWVLLRLARSNEVRNDLFAVVGLGIIGALLALLIFNNQLNGMKGCLVWSFIALGLGCIRYTRSVWGTHPASSPQRTGRATAPRRRTALHPS